jgi:hypothetical protein
VAQQAAAQQEISGDQLKRAELQSSLAAMVAHKQQLEAQQRATEIEHASSKREVGLISAAFCCFLLLDVAYCSWMLLDAGQWMLLVVGC